MPITRAELGGIKPLVRALWAPTPAPGGEPGEDGLSGCEGAVGGE